MVFDHFASVRWWRLCLLAPTLAVACGDPCLDDGFGKIGAECIPYVAETEGGTAVATGSGSDSGTAVPPSVSAT